MQKQIGKLCFVSEIIASELRRKFLSSPGNMLTNSLKNLDITKRDFFHLNCLHSDQKIW